MITRRTLFGILASLPLVGTVFGKGIDKPVYDPSKVQITIGGVPIDPSGYEIIKECRNILSVGVGVPKRLLFGESDQSKEG